MSKTKYRILPYGDYAWKVQESTKYGWLSNGEWRDVEDYVEGSVWITRKFETEKDAEKFIDDQIWAAKKYEEWKAHLDKRKRDIPPREYP